MYKICTFVPETHLEIVKQALFEAGAGRIGDYDSCCWQTAGQGQFRPLQGSTPFIGSKRQVETLEEYKLELVCRDDKIKTAIRALRNAHPYETPAIDVWQLADTF